MPSSKTSKSLLSNEGGDILINYPIPRSRPIKDKSNYNISRYILFKVGSLLDLQPAKDAAKL